MSHDATDACDGWDGSECEGTVHCPPRCPRFVDKQGARWTIRPGVSEDAAALAEMYEGFGTADRAQGLPPVTRSRRADWLETMLADGSNVVAERNGEPFGHAMYTPTDAARPELAVFVHPEMQGAAWERSSADTLSPTPTPETARGSNSTSRAGTGSHGASTGRSASNSPTAGGTSG